MNEYKTIDSLFKKFANPIKEDYEALAVSLMKNFSITKCEKDSEGIRNVKYRIADLEIYRKHPMQTVLYKTNKPKS